MNVIRALGLILVSFSAVLAQQGRTEQITRAQIKEAERLLSEQGFWTGPIDGVLDAGSNSALLAFQKWHGRELTGQITTEELEAIRSGASPQARELGYPGAACRE